MFRPTGGDKKNAAGQGQSDAGTMASAAQVDIAAIYKDNAKQLTANLRKAFGNGPPDPDDIT
ncbi:MAG: hypothetical protein AAF197_13060, partial [Pseudomonadota bacterium]